MEWMAAVRDHPDRPPTGQRLVLISLALRMDWSTSQGFASADQLARDADCEERTVRRATTWARTAGLIERTRRGHRISAERVIASEWRLTRPPSQPDTGDLLGKSQPDTDDRLGKSQPDNRPDPTGQWGPPNRTAAHPHQDLGLQDLGTYGDVGKAAFAAQPTRTQPDSPLRRYVEAAGPGTVDWPMCPQCGKPFTQERLLAFDDDFLQMALEGEVLCSKECEHANNHCSQCGAQLQGDEVGMCVWCSLPASKNGTTP